MTPRTTGLIVVVFALVAAATVHVLGQQPAQTPEERLGAALHQAEVAGDLQKAVNTYREIIADKSANRGTVASALLGLGAAYEKLGRPEARAQYERVLAEFADQTAIASTARSRLAAATPAPGSDAVSLRRIWAGSNNVSRDGRFLIHGKGMRDLVAGVDIALPVGDIHRGVTVLSPDTTQIVFESCAAFGECELRIADRGQPNTSRRLYQNPDVRLSPQDWSADGKWIAVKGSRADSTGHVGLLRMPEGTLHVLKSTDWRTSTRLLFSPDGRYLAFDIAVSDESPARDVYAIAIDGSREIPMAVSPAHEAVMGWSPDGRRLLFASDRGGSMDLWSLAIADGRPEGAAERVRSNIGNVSSMRVATNGALYLRADNNERDVAVTSLDLETGSQTSPAIRPVSRFPGTNFEPAWSADGSRLAYVSERGTAGDADFGELVLGIRDASGETRELQLRPRLAWFVGLNWSRDGRSIAVTAVDAKGRPGIFRVDAATGEVTPIAQPIPLTYEGIFWSPDERRIYYRALDGAVRERDVATGDERVIFDERGMDFGKRTGPISLSPDGRWIATYRSETVFLLSTEGGAPRELHRFAPREVGNKPMVINNNPMPWTPDGQAVLVWRTLMDPACGAGHACQTELWQVPTDGGSARKLAVNLDGAIGGQLGKLRLSADGRQLAYVAGRSYQRETWVLENFLPPPARR